MASRWYVGRTGPRSERIADHNLQLRGAQCYLPTILAPESTDGASKYSPLFPGYLFLSWDMESEGFAPIQHVEGFRGFVRFEDTIPPLPENAIDEVRAVEDAINRRGGLTAMIHAGQQVRVSFARTDTLGQALQSARTARDRIWVLMKWFGRTVRAKVRASDLQPVGDPPHLNPLPPGERQRNGGGSLPLSQPSSFQLSLECGSSFPVNGQPPRRRTRGRGRYVKEVRP